jgi:hypothetical protein
MNDSGLTRLQCPTRKYTAIWQWEKSTEREFLKELLASRRPPPCRWQADLGDGSLHLDRPQLRIARRWATSSPRVPRTPAKRSVRWSPQNSVDQAGKSLNIAGDETRFIGTTGNCLTFLLRYNPTNTRHPTMKAISAAFLFLTTTSILNAQATRHLRSKPRRDRARHQVHLHPLTFSRPHRGGCPRFAKLTWGTRDYLCIRLVCIL